MLATETDVPFDHKDWIFEIKWDGYRAIAEVDGKKVSLYSRNGNSFNASYPIVVDALSKLGIKAVLDGEIIVENEKGIPDFQLLQHYKEDPDHPILYYVFDLLKVKNKTLYQLPLIERKALLAELLPENEVVRYSDHIGEEGKALFRIALNKDLEGIMGKRADSLYEPGKRTTNWLKIKHHKTLDAVIAGFTAPTGGRKFFGALVLGIKKGKKLSYIGHTGSGFTVKSLKEMYELLKPMIRKTSPFEEVVKTNMPVTWVEPKLVCEIKYSELTADGKMRHPIFLHLRSDKTAKETTMASVKTVTKKEAAAEDTAAKAEYTYGKIKVPVTNQDKIFWPDEGITKGDVIRYYREIADYILPYLKNRPQSLKRNPNGIKDKGFFHKDAGDEAPSWVKSIPIYSESTKKDVNYILCNNAATLTYLNNLGCIEINPWNSVVDSLDKPDYLIIDIDPSERNTFEEVIEAAQVVHEVLEKAGAPNFCKTSGATGLHVYVPTNRKYTYDQLRDFAHLICMLTQEQLPRTTSLERNLKERGHKIYMDHLQNRRGQTIAAAYSLRPHPGATVSTPLLWKEVKKGLSPGQFDIVTLPARLKKTGDLFTGILGKGINLQSCLKKLSE